MDELGGRPDRTPAYTVRPRTEQEVLDVVRFAVRDGWRCAPSAPGTRSPRSCRPAASWSTAAALTGITGIDVERRRARMLAGTRISELGPALWEPGLSLSNQGDIDHQSIAGALATATHGSGIDQTSFSVRLRGARIVTGTARSWRSVRATGACCWPRRPPSARSGS